MKENLFHKYGGTATVAAIVQEFYDEVLETPELSHFFQGVSMERLIEHQVKFLSHVLGGPANYQGRSLRAAHHGLKIDSASFERVASILCDVLRDAGMTSEDVQTVLTIVDSTRAEIVSE